MQFEKYLTIHGHFYQPPRENPWLGVIERQDSATPFHNWNERITAECYKANTLSRTLDSKGRILDIVSNYKYLSFNIGPTLINWLQEYHPATYEAIIESDLASRALNGGHGNAMAQVYNHVIMPLAGRREQELQIILGKRDFVRHFGREPEAMWLAETAINRTTAELLMDHGIRFTILSPFQARRIRKIGEDHWTDVRNGAIDTTMPYRIFSNGKHLDVFFFNKGVSTSVAFEHLLRDANRFGERLSSAWGKEAGRPKLINICTDGESYGHHEPFGDMCLSAFFSSIAQKFRFRVTNYGYFLERFSPFMEVELEQGGEGKGTSWSCSHGVDRWRKNCGCSAGSRAGWNQEWRTPLREGLNKVKEELDKTFEQAVREYLPDPWAAFIDFVDLRRERSQEKTDGFFAKHAGKNVEDRERAKLLQLMESQLNSLLMFTSCAWFFDDISGLEPLQNMRYAARAIEMSGRPELHEVLLRELEKARSNAGGETGKSLYEKHVRPMLGTPPLIANQAAMEWALLGKENGGYFFYEIALSGRERFENHGLALGDLEVRDPFLGLRKKYFFFCAETEDAFLKTWLGEDLSHDARSALVGKLTRLARGELSFISPSEIGNESGLACYTLSDLLEHHREEILVRAMSQAFDGLKKTALNFFLKNEEMIKRMVKFGVDLPSEVRLTVSYALHHKLQCEMEYLHGETDPRKFGNAVELIQLASRLQIPVKTTDFEKKVLLKTLYMKLNSLFRKPDAGTLQEVRSITEIISALGLKVDLAPAQNVLFNFLKGPFTELWGKREGREIGQEAYRFAEMALDLADGVFGINVDRFRALLK
ncbi:MAG: DUF3536 domain-containing protein [Nitrospinae bacterium]|nr:DUF3536 domain-containing protein [Nitrospinota bacterium]